MKRKVQGHTLIELLIAVFIISILVLVSINFKPSLSRSEASILTEEIVFAVQYARSQALIRGKNLYLQPLEQGSWSMGAQLKDRLNGTTLRQWRWPNRYWRLEWRGAQSQDYIVFSDDPLKSMSNGRFLIIDDKNQTVKQLVVNRMGRIKRA